MICVHPLFTQAWMRPSIVLNNLCRLTSLQCSFSCKMVGVHNGQPKQIGSKGVAAERYCPNFQETSMSKEKDTVKRPSSEDICLIKLPWHCCGPG
ncbi:DNA gyrase subunit A chloroplastic/mitochondrial-like [Prunus yedoensis var. nudiflora]|uniref:DNA gyrase subunit A chloroplastic/mitochondrial-like n=1 Tax=Prunus yedoensis var. nudiflora TaxID=2094558 RepID=A0A314Y8N8_PRUYE|nr:DNA gyrase subunit A chloroplastic/mitochondrial-like [Prunus yedoensis var. nudiflora]